MTRFSAFISALAFATALSAQTTVGNKTVNVGESVRYSTLISFRGSGVSGISILKLKEENMLVGALINEFGIKAMDFTYNRKKGKAKLVNVISFLDKWYIRKVVQADLAFMLKTTESTTTKHRVLTVEDDGAIDLQNKKYNINYHLIPITEDATKE